MSDQVATTACQAAAREDSRYLQLALAAGGNPNRVSAVGGVRDTAPLFCAVLAKNVANIKLLHSAGADLDMQEYHKETPMMYAADLNSWDVVYALLELGADPSIEDNWGKTIVHSIESRRMNRESELYVWRIRVTEILRKRGVSVTPRN